MGEAEGELVCASATALRPQLTVYTVPSTGDAERAPWLQVLLLYFVASGKKAVGVSDISPRQRRQQEFL